MASSRKQSLLKAINESSAIQTQELTTPFTSDAASQSAQVTIHAARVVINQFPAPKLPKRRPAPLP